MEAVGHGYREDGKLRVWVSARTKSGVRLITLHAPKLRIDKDCFLEAVWLSHFVGSMTSSCAVDRAVSGVVALDTLSQDKQQFARRFLNASAETPFTRTEGQRFLTIIHEAIEKKWPGAPSLRALHNACRAFFRDGFNSWHAQGVIDFNYHDLQGFLPDLPADSRNRAKMLSSHEDPESRAPKSIIDLHFDSIEDARQNMLDHVDTRLVELRAKCFEALDHWEKQKSTLIRLADALPDERYEEIKSLVMADRTVGKRDHWVTASLSGEVLAAFYVKEFLREQLHNYERLQEFLRNCHQFVYPSEKRVAEYLQSLGMQNPGNALLEWLIVSLAYYGADKMVAIKLLILSETGLNPQPVADMQVSQCRRVKGQTAQWEIMPVKRKTMRGKGQEQTLTPADAEQMQVLPKHPTKQGDKPARSAFDAMDLLMANYENLHRDWQFEPGSETYLFSLPNRNHALRARHRHSRWGAMLNRFKSRWRINPDYSFQQIRSQVGGQTVLRYQGNLFVVRNKLGHADLGTSYGYVAELLGVLDDLIIRQFERQIAATILFAVGGEEVVYAQGLQQEDINTHMLPIRDLSDQPAQVDDLDAKLVSVGNGVGCKAPTNSPNRTIPPGELCDGHQCYMCGNAKIIITENRVRENIQMLCYFRDNLEGLRGRNPDHWKEHGVKELAFQIALAKVIQDSRYRLMYERIERELSRQQTHSRGIGASSGGL